MASGASALRRAAAFWYAVAVCGQFIFLSYVATVYGGAVLRHDLSGWNQVMQGGYIAGDTRGNVAIGTHLLLAVLVMLGGALQLIPAVRSRAPAFHRWNGRVYVASAVIASVTGLYMVWFRGTVGDATQHVGVSVNGILIIAFAGLALRTAMARDFASHRRWALRLFLAVSGVWFFRIMLMFWLAVHGRPVGFDPKTFEGPFLSVLSFAQYLLPLAVLELYLRCRERGTPVARYAMAAALLVLALATAAGIAVAAMGMWLPRMR